MRDWKTSTNDDGNARLATVIAYASSIVGYWFFTLPDIHLYDMYSILLFIMYTAHFVRRIYEAIAIQKFTRATSSFEMFGGCIYYGLFGAAIGYQNNYYMPDTFKMYIGLELWTLGEFGNYYHHKLLSDLRQKKTTNNEGDKKEIPHGGLFSMVSSPHYFFEVVSWIGFTVASGFSWSSIIFTVLGAYSMTNLAIEKHQIYKKTFNGENGMPLYPPERKIIVPLFF